MSTPYDALIIGGGHNGLVAAAYLAKAGLSVCLLERRSVLGGACVTEPLWEGCKVSTAAYVCGLLHPKVVKDLALPQHGFELLRRDPSSFTPLPDGGSLLLGSDPTQNAEQIRRFSRRDAERFQDYEAAMDRLARFLEPLLVTVPPRFPHWAWSDLLVYGRMLGGLGQLPPRERWLLTRLLTASAWEVLSEWFESEPLRVTLATDGVIGTALSPTMPTTALVLFHHIMGSITGRRGIWGYVRGGMGALSEAIAQVARRHGATLRTEAEVRQVLLQGERVSGVVLSDGEEIRARAILSNADPQRTFLQLVPPSALPEEFRACVQRLKMSAASFKVNLLVDRLPSFRCLPGEQPAPHHRGTIHLCPSLEYLERAYADFAQGRPSERPMVEMCLPTVLDETLAPRGQHLVSLFVQYAPYQPREGWLQEKDAFLRRILAVVEEFAPGFSSSVLRVHCLSPQDLEEEFALTRGNIFHGDLAPDQMFSFRPVAGWGQYRTPLQGLYLCGAGAHPGGGIIGAAGHNAAQVLLQDLRWGRLRS